MFPTSHFLHHVIRLLQNMFSVCSCLTGVEIERWGLKFDSHIRTDPKEMTGSHALKRSKGDDRERPKLCCLLAQSCRLEGDRGALARVRASPSQEVGGVRPKHRKGFEVDR